MSPQPAKPAAENGDAPAPEVRPYNDLLTGIESKDEDARTSPEKQIHRANLLERQRADLMKKIAANRDYLRLMEQNDELTDEQADWLDDFYPQKEKGERRSDDEIERTRKVKEAARK